VKVVQIPDGWTLELPSFNLTYHVSPFPTLQPEALTDRPYDIPDGKVWVKLAAGKYGLFPFRSLLRVNRCPLCGGEYGEKEEKE